MAIIPALSVQYSKAGMYVDQFCLAAINFKLFLNPELAATPPAIAICLILVCKAAVFNLDNKYVTIVC